MFSKFPLYEQNTPLAILYRYGLAILIAIVSTLITAFLWNFTNDAPFILLVGAVVLSAWIGGLLPGMLCAAVTILLVDYFLVEPRYALFSTPTSILQFVLFGLVAGIVSWLEEQRHRSERILRQYREELEVILNGVNDGITALDVHGKTVFANAASERILGQPLTHAPTAAEQRAMGGDKLLNDHNTTMAHTIMPYTRVFATGAPAEMTFGIKPNDGSAERWFNLKSSPVFDKDGQVRLAVNIFHDITEKRRIEKMRQESSTRLRKVIDNLAVFVAVLRPDGTLIEANRSTLHAINQEFADLIDMPFDQTYWWSYDAAVQTRLRESIQQASKGETVRYDVDVRVGDNRFITIDFILAPVLDERGRVEYLIPSGIDVTDRNNLTRQLQEQQQRLAGILNNVPGIVFEGVGAPENGEQTMTFLSAYVEQLLGYTADEWVKDPAFWKKIILPEDLEAVTASAKEAFEQGKPSILTFRCTTRDGQVVTLETHASVMQDKANTPIGMMGVIMDVSERRQIEEDMVHYAEELRRSNEELEQFAYVASHDLQEPLRMVASYLQLIEQRYINKLDNDAKEFIAFAVDGSSRMKILINDLLTYSRIQRNRVEFEMVPMKDALDQALHHLQLAIEDSKAVITHDPLPELHANRLQMMQLLQNLVGNALKFCGENPPKIHIGVKRQSAEWHFMVTDNGIGIESEYLERIFVIFQRLHTRTQYPGTGIGLAICKKIVDKHGGEIYAESTVGNGTTFHFTIPFKQIVRRAIHGTHPHPIG